MLTPIPAQTNIRSFPIVAKADGSAIVTGTVNYYLIANTGANAGKWYQDSDATWQAAESLAKAMTFKGGAVWQVTPKADAFINGVEYTEYAKESGALHIPVERDFRCVYVIATDSAGKVVVPDTQKVDAIAISGDTAAADALETMLDGTGGNKLTLEQLRINSASAGGGIDIDNSNGDGISAAGAGVGINATGAIGIQAFGTNLGILATGINNGINANGTNGYGIFVTGGGGEDISANITGNITGTITGDITGTITSVTDVTNVTNAPIDASNLDAKISTRSTFAGGAVASVTDVTNVTNAALVVTAGKVAATADVEITPEQITEIAEGVAAGIDLSNLDAAVSTRVTPDQLAAALAPFVPAFPAPEPPLTAGYCSRAHIENVFGTTNIRTWADLDNDGDAAKIDARITWVISVVQEDIDSRFRRSLYTLPLQTADANVPWVIIGIAANLAGVMLYESRGITDFNPETGAAVHKLGWNKKQAEDTIQSILVNSRQLDAISRVTSSTPGPEVIT